MNDPIISTDEKQTRREACLSLARYAALGGIGLLWAGLYIRSSLHSVPAGCGQSLQCGGCSLLKECNLPRAADARNGDKK